MSLGFGFASAFLMSQEVLASQPDLVVDLGDGAGLTKYGITAKEYPAVNLATLTMAGALEIYERDYWQPLQLDLLPWAVATCVLDGAVNQGQATCFKLLQGVLGVPEDGLPGPVTAAAAKARGPGAVGGLIAARAFRYSQSPNWPRFRAVWMGRLLACHRYCAGVP